MLPHLCMLVDTLVHTLAVWHQLDGYRHLTET